MSNRSYNQKEVWEEFTSAMTVESIVNNVHHPAIFQQELAGYLNGILHDKGKVIEVGCEAGVTSFLLNTNERCFFDLDEGIIAKSKEAHEILCKDHDRDKFVVGNMFDMPFEDDYFDLTFNAGVLEHFSRTEVVAALKEMERVTKSNGKVVVAIPNHYCPVYRLAYLVGIFLDFLHIRKWPWPKENKYYDFREEIAEVDSLVFENRMTLSKKSIWNWLGGVFILARFLLMLIDKFHPFEGYLTVITMRKKQK